MKNVEWIVNFRAFNYFKWLLLNSKTDWKQVSVAAEFIMQEIKDIAIYDAKSEFKIK